MQFLSGIRWSIGKVIVVVFMFILWWHYSHAKRGYLQQEGVSNPSMNAIQKAVTKEELSRHCCRRTRGAGVTLQLIEELLLQLYPPPLIPLVCLCSVYRWSPSRIKKQSMSDAYRILQGWPCTLSQGTSIRVGLNCQCSDVRKGPPCYLVR